MTVIKGLFSLIIIMLVILAVLFVDFAYKTFSLGPQEVKADAIVVLTGGRGRVEEGIRLYRDNQARWLFLVGVDPAVRKSELFREQPGARGGEGVILEKVSRNTLENAIYARELVVRHQVRSLKLITSRYHMKRATLIFRSVLSKEVAIYPYPVDSKNLKEAWWSHGGSFRLLFSEFYKYCLFRFFFLFGSGELRPASFNL
ncbi:YdcF family protein [Geomobilimonas luticola]|uniref:YdcF family protein n=1 Tax=Geomobilimonas luticola TaxID=1114878 RepID=A0ABS5SFR7_9BACT|nr:YdcF family protein [Geomobilimonas luticola]MBT0654193.1 YdcF family protein [Geomobilimonas luticola]